MPAVIRLETLDSTICVAAVSESVAVVVTAIPTVDFHDVSGHPGLDLGSGIDPGPAEGQAVVGDAGGLRFSNCPAQVLWGGQCPGVR